jgi:hypothetical protein
MFPPQDELVMPESTPSTDDRQQQEMTWQQQRDFGPAVVSEIAYLVLVRELRRPHTAHRQLDIRSMTCSELLHLTSLPVFEPFLLPNPEVVSLP